MRSHNNIHQWVGIVALIPIIIIILAVVLPRVDIILEGWHEANGNPFQWYCWVIRSVKIGDIFALISGLFTYYGTLILAVVTIKQNDNILGVSKRQLWIQDAEAREKNRPELSLTNLYVAGGTYEEAESLSFDPSDHCKLLYPIKQERNREQAREEEKITSNYEFEDIPNIAWGIVGIQNLSRVRARSVCCFSSQVMPQWMTFFVGDFEYWGKRLVAVLCGDSWKIEKKLRNIKATRNLQSDELKTVIDKITYKNLEIIQYVKTYYGDIVEKNTVYIPFVVEQGIGVEYETMVSYNNPYGHSFYNILNVRVKLIGEKFTMDATLSPQYDWLVNTDSAVPKRKVSCCYQTVELKLK